MEFLCLILQQLLVAGSEKKVVALGLGWLLFPRKAKLCVFHGAHANTTFTQLSYVT